MLVGHRVYQMGAFSEWTMTDNDTLLKNTYDFILSFYCRPNYDDLSFVISGI